MKNIIFTMLIASIACAAQAVNTSFLKTTKVGGYMDTEWISTDTTSTFRAHRLVLYTGAQVAENVRFSSEIEYEYGGFVSNTDSSKTNQKGEIKIEQAWVDHTISDAFVIRTGIILVPIGQMNQYHDSNLRDFTDRPLVDKFIIPTTWADTGIGVHGSVELGASELTYEGYIINGLRDTNEFSASSGTRSLRPNFKNDTNAEKAIAVRVGFIPNIHMSAGISVYRQGLQSMNALDLLFKYSVVSLKTEMADYSDQFSNHATGFNIEGKLNLAPWLNGRQWSALARTELVDITPGDQDLARQRRHSVGVLYRPMPSFAYKLDYGFLSNSGQKSNQFMASVAIGF
jgi:hypothetical protein